MRVDLMVVQRVDKKVDSWAGKKVDN